MDEDYGQDDLLRIGGEWLTKIRAAEKREDKWRCDAERAQTAFLCRDDDGLVPDFNILHSNVETIIPAVYNSTPNPDVRPRHNNPDDIAKAAADVWERAIQSLIDDDALDVEIEALAQDTEVAGRGVIRLRFDADVGQEPMQDDWGQVVTDEDGEPVLQETVQNERIIYENVSWDDYREGPATRWTLVPWVAFRHRLSVKEMARITDDDFEAKQAETFASAEDEPDQDVWEIWCKETSRVYFVADTGKVLSIGDDPLGLKDFFPMPKPVQPITPTGDRKPVCPYSVYKELADELNRLTRRIKGIVAAVKVKGGVIGDAGGWEMLAQAGDNELVPIPDLENYAAAGGISNAIVWWPVEQAAAVLAQLYVQREAVKQTIYEVTGISDIVRGASEGGETATAQQIKTQWGSLRIKRRQRMIQRLVRDVFVLSTEIMARHFSTEAMQNLAGMEIAPEVEQLLRDPFAFFRVDVESDSTVRADLTSRRGEMAEFMAGTAQFFSTMAPIVQQQPQAAGPIIEMYSAFARQWNLGKQAEDGIDQLVKIAKASEGQEQGPSPEQQAEMAKMQLEQAKLQQDGQLKSQQMQMDMQVRMAELQLRQAELQLKAQEGAIKARDLGLKEQVAEFDAVAKMAEIEIEMDQERAVKVG